MQYWLEQDGSAGSPITHLDRPVTKLRFLLEDVTAVGYRLRHARSVAIVGAGGGRDILAALASGAERVDAIELNPAVVEALRGPFAAWSGGVYDLPGVQAIVADGRSALSRSVEPYDLIQIALVDSWAATAAGAFALSENGLYTLEAFRLYWSRLSTTGLLSTSRWIEGSSGLEVPRLVILARAALESEGVSRAIDHLAVVQGGRVGTLLVSRTPWSRADLVALDRAACCLGFTVHWPELRPGSGAGWMVRLLREGAGAYREFGLRLEPPTDDRPFFFQMASPWKAPASQIEARTGLTMQPVRALRQLLGVTGAVALGLFFSPFALRRRLPRFPEFWRASALFALIGLGFMLVEVSWLHRSVTYLGHPSRAASVVLTGLLLGAGIGSWLSSQLPLRAAKRHGWLLGTLLFLLSAGMSLMQGATWSSPDWLKALLLSGFVGSGGVLLGLALPLGMARFGDEGRGWFWALNGTTSVLGSVLAPALAMEIGLGRVAQLGALAYVLGWPLFLRRSERNSPINLGG